MRTCESCRWYLPGMSAAYDRCHNPAVPAMEAARLEREIQARVRAEAGEKPVTVYCESARRFHDQCGPDGRFWEQTDVPF